MGATSSSAVGPTLHVLMHGHEIATLQSSREGRAKLEYAADASDVTRGLSCSLPVLGVRYSGERVTNWLGGLLPDRSEVLTRWRARYGVTRQDAYALLWHVGEDVAGAAQFVRPERLNTVGAEGSLQTVNDEAIGRRIRDLVSDATTWAPTTGAGQFSLAGAQAKFALARTADGWAEPSGSYPTTHIFKPAIPGMLDQDLNEHLTMRLAQAVGLAVAQTQVASFDGARALVVTRFDRRQTAGGEWRRVHQEDAVQALGLPPSLKYEAQGGPGVRQVVQLLRANVPTVHASGDIDRLLDAVAFNWLVAGTDAHARNYALLHHGPSTRLAPLYDLNSFLPYGAARPMHLAMRIGYTAVDVAKASAPDWDELARDCGIDSERLLGRVRLLAEGLLQALDPVLTDADATAWNSPLPGLLGERLQHHVTACLQRV